MSSEKSLEKTLIWDYPIRVFHFVFSTGIALAWIIGQTASHKSEAFLYHTLLGLMVAFALLLRLFYGIFAPGHSSLKSFFVSPNRVVDYFKGILKRNTEHHGGHNPASAWVSLGMMAVLIGLIVTGLVGGQGSHAAEELHEGLAAAMAFLVGAHVVGIVLFTLKSKENIGLSMVHGKKIAPVGSQTVKPRLLLGVIAALLVTAWGVGLFQSLDAKTKSTKIPGTSVELQLKKLHKKKSAPKN